MKALVVNCSVGHYNLGAEKLAGWLVDMGYQTTRSDGDPGLSSYGYDLVAVSAIFSWHAPVAREIALRVRDHAEVWCGGPGMFALTNWWRRETGLDATRGLDPRFERQRGTYRMTFASRGCPVGCSFCIVPKLEGLDFTLDWDFQPAPVLCDNNLSALPVEFQDHIISRYLISGTALVDANSGFEPRTFDGNTFARWAPILRGPWRCAYDTLDEGAEVKAVMALLNGVARQRKRVYVLVGNEPFEACHERATKVLEWGAEPYCQAYRPLNALTKSAVKVAYDWTPQRLTDFCRYYNRHLWKYTSLIEYDRSVRTARTQLAPEQGVLV